jgi:hypothetical protein
MPETYMELTEDEFDDQYPLVENHLNPSAGWVIGNGRGSLFETYGQELAFIRQQDPRCIWTLMEGDSGLAVVSGMHFVNRLGYLISRVPAPENAFIEVRCDTCNDDLEDTP